MYYGVRNNAVIIHAVLSPEDPVCVFPWVVLLAHSKYLTPKLTPFPHSIHFD